MKMTSSYEISGMTCEHCVRAVTQEVGEIPGVTVESVDLDSGFLTISSQQLPAREDVRAAVEEAGYELV
jgi:copper chaperone